MTAINRTVPRHRRGERAKRRAGAILAVTLLTGCVGTTRMAAPSAPEIPGVTIERSGFATLTQAPPTPLPATAPPPAPSQAVDPAARMPMNPDDDAMNAASALDQRLAQVEAGNYVGMRIVRDPAPRVAFHFRRDAAATFARYSADRRFAVVEGGVPPAELQPILDAWLDRFAAEHIPSGGGIDPFAGVIRFQLGIEETAFRTLAAQEGWTVPNRLRLEFAPPRSTWTIDPALARLVRIFPREDRVPVMVNTAAIHGRLILRDGCFRVQQPDSRNAPLVIFARDAELMRDGQGYLAVGGADGPAARIGEQAVWSGPQIPGEADAGVRALRAKCGGGEVVGVGVPRSVAAFRVRLWAIDAYTRHLRIPRQAAWDRIRACWTREDARRERRNLPPIALEDCDDPIDRDAPPVRPPT